MVLELLAFAHLAPEKSHPSFRSPSRPLSLSRSLARLFSLSRLTKFLPSITDEQIDEILAEVHNIMRTASTEEEKDEDKEEAQTAQEESKGEIKKRKEVEKRKREEKEVENEEENEKDKPNSKVRNEGTRETGNMK